MIEPCVLYEAFMGPDLFEPAGLDAEIHHVLDKENEDYYMGWSYFKFCRALTSDEAGVFEAVINRIESRDE